MRWSDARRKNTWWGMRGARLANLPFDPDSLVSSAAMPLVGVIGSLCQSSCGCAHLPYDRRCFASVPKQHGRDTTSHGERAMRRRDPVRARCPPGHAPRSAVGMEPTDAPAGQLVPIYLATPRGDTQCKRSTLDLRALRSTLTWTEEMATSLPTMRTIRHQPRGLRQRTCTILKKLLQNHTHCHNQCNKRRGSDSLQAELAAARWAWLAPRCWFDELLRSV